MVGFSVEKPTKKPKNRVMGSANPGDNWDKDLPSERMKAKIISKCHISLFAWMAETRSTIKVLFTSYFASNPESESNRSPESDSEPESDQPHHDSAPLAPYNVFCCSSLQAPLKLRQG